MKAARRCDLAHPAGVDQAEVGDDGVDQRAVPRHRHVEQAALLEAVVGDVVVADVADRPARQQRVAVLAVAGRRRWCGRRRRSPRARGSRPAAPSASRTGCRGSGAPRRGSCAALPAGTRGRRRAPRCRARGCGSRAASAGRRRARPCGCCRWRRAARCCSTGCWRGMSAAGRADHRVGQGAAVRPGTAAAAGSPRRSTARSSGRRRRATRSHSKRRCSRGARRTGMSRGTRRPNTCSVLRVTPGA